jgi:hypothetical protein
MSAFRRVLTTTSVTHFAPAALSPYKSGAPLAPVSGALCPGPTEFLCTTARGFFSSARAWPPRGGPLTVESTSARPRELFLQAVVARLRSPMAGLLWPGFTIACSRDSITRRTKKRRSQKGALVRPTEQCQFSREIRTCEGWHCALRRSLCAYRDSAHHKISPTCAWFYWSTLAREPAMADTRALRSKSCPTPVPATQAIPKPRFAEAFFFCVPALIFVIAPRVKALTS